jgi:hypothetical protein
VAESNLRVQMAALRKVLNQDRDIIKTVHRRGYVFTGEVSTASVKSHTLVWPISEPTRIQAGPTLQALRLAPAGSPPHRFFRRRGRPHSATRTSQRKGQSTRRTLPV